MARKREVTRRKAPERIRAPSSQPFVFNHLESSAWLFGSHFCRREVGVNQRHCFRLRRLPSAPLQSDRPFFASVLPGDADTAAILSFSDIRCDRVLGECTSVVVRPPLVSPLAAAGIPAGRPPPK